MHLSLRHGCFIALTTCVMLITACGTTNTSQSTSGPTLGAISLAASPSPAATAMSAATTSPVTAATTSPSSPPTTSAKPPTATPVPAWSSSDRWGLWANAGYYLSNDVWGSGIGPQTIWAYAYNHWGVTSNQPPIGGVKAYPHVGKNVDIAINALNTLTSDFAVIVPNSGAYETAYDIWCNNYSYEIMIWVNKTGPVHPIGKQVTTVALGGYTWNVWNGSNNTNPVFSFFAPSNNAFGHVDIKAILSWIEQQGWYGNVTVHDVQFGFEITSTTGALNFTTQNFAVAAS